MVLRRSWASGPGSNGQDYLRRSVNHLWSRAISWTTWYRSRDAQWTVPTLGPFSLSALLPSATHVIPLRTLFEKEGGVRGPKEQMSFGRSDPARRPIQTSKGDLSAGAGRVGRAPGSRLRPPRSQRLLRFIPAKDPAPRPRIFNVMS